MSTPRVPIKTKKSMRPLSVIARTACDMYSWFLVAFGAYVIVHGDVTPGGGFQGGSMCATFLALMLIAEGSDYIDEWLNINLYKFCLYIGLFMFLGFGLMGIGWAFDGTLMLNWATVPHNLLGVVKPWWPPSGTVALMDIAVGIEVTGGLSLILITMFHAIRLGGVLEDGKGKETGHDQR